MFTSARFFQSFARHGFLVQATWKPCDDQPEEIAQVDFRSVSDNLFNDAVYTVSYNIMYPDTVFIGLAEGDIIIINGKEYDVQAPPAPVQDGSVIQASLGER